MALTLSISMLKAVLRSVIPALVILIVINVSAITLLYVMIGTKAVMKEVMFRYIKTTNMLISDLLSQVGNLILPILQSALKHSRILNLVILMN